jgi:glycolate oxidase FAD binding subunit
VGAARDHFLGFRAVSGRAEVFKAGGKVVKNVTGYDLPKLMAGSYGTLAALEEVTIKVLPRPEDSCTLMMCGLDAAPAVQRLIRALASPHEISGAAYLPASLFAPGTSHPGSPGIAALRLEGPPLSVAFRRERLLAELGSDCEAAVLEAEPSAEFWRSIRDVAPLSQPADRVVWRVSVAANRGAQIGEGIAREIAAGWYLDWGGGLLWVAVAGTEDGGAAVIRGAIRGPDGRGTGHATLVRGSSALRLAVPVFEPQAAPLAALAARVKLGFDPHRILNPGRMVEGS